MRRLLYILFFASVSFVAKSQDLHYTQYYFVDFNTNPGYTGLYKEDYRLGLIHRSQWKGIDAAFTTTSFFADFKLKAKWLNKDHIGIGVVVSNDELIEKVFQNRHVQFNIAYYRQLDHAMRHHLSVAIQPSYTNKNFNSDDLIFGNQYQGFVYDPNLPNHENLDNLNLNYLDFNFGVLWKYKMAEEKLLYSGIAAHDLTTPPETFLTTGASSSKENSLGTRLSFHQLYQQSINHKLRIKAGYLLMLQSKARDLIVGGLGYYQVNNGIEVKGGIQMRVNDSFHLLSGLIYKNWDLGIAYDWTISSLNDIKTADNLNDRAYTGAWEIGLIYKGIFKNKIAPKLTTPCGVF